MPDVPGAIARSGLGRVVFALSGEQLDGLRPPDVVAPDATEVRYDGPALLEEAQVPVRGYYDWLLDAGGAQLERWRDSSQRRSQTHEQ